MGIGGAVPFLALLRLVSFCGSRCEGLVAQLLRGLTRGTLDCASSPPLAVSYPYFFLVPAATVFFSDAMGGDRILFEGEMNVSGKDRNNKDVKAWAAQEQAHAAELKADRERAAHLLIERQKQAENAFSEADTDHSGSISQSELLELLMHIQQREIEKDGVTAFKRGKLPDREAVSEWLKSEYDKADIDHNGEIDFGACPSRFALLVPLACLSPLAPSLASSTLLSRTHIHILPSLSSGYSASLPHHPVIVPPALRTSHLSPRRRICRILQQFDHAHALEVWRPR